MFCTSLRSSIHHCYELKEAFLLQSRGNLLEPATPPLHHAAVPAPSAWLVPPQAFPLDTSKSSPWLSGNTQSGLSRSCWTELAMEATVNWWWRQPLEAAGQLLRLPTGLCVWKHHLIYSRTEPEHTDWSSQSSSSLKQLSTLLITDTV